MYFKGIFPSIMLFIHVTFQKINPQNQITVLFNCVLKKGRKVEREIKERRWLLKSNKRPLLCSPCFPLTTERTVWSVHPDLLSQITRYVIEFHDIISIERKQP